MNCGWKEKGGSCHNYFNHADQKGLMLALTATAHICGAHTTPERLKSALWEGHAIIDSERCTVRQMVSLRLILTHSEVKEQGEFGVGVWLGEDKEIIALYWESKHISFSRDYKIVILYLPERD